ncbi:MAG: cytidine deaminase [Bacteroidales bacterium]|nr:cytidine deaminase [Bacteroidales bacterium]
MIERQLNISYAEYATIDEMEPGDAELCRAAIAALDGSYAPYSHFNVGAAVRLTDGTVVKGANQENAAYPSGICAERTAMFAASAQYPDQEMCSIAVVGAQEGTICPEPATPCGACRQVMAQYQTRAGAPMSVILIGGSRIWKFEKVDDVLPFIFDTI